MMSLTGTVVAVVDMSACSAARASSIFSMHLEKGFYTKRGKNWWWRRAVGSGWGNRGKAVHPLRVRETGVRGGLCDVS